MIKKCYVCRENWIGETEFTCPDCYAAQADPSRKIKHQQAHLKEREIEAQLKVAAVSKPLAQANLNMTLPTDSEERKGYPLLNGCLRYFPAALAGVASTSRAGNDKHNPGQPLHHARGKSMDHGDCILRHLMDLQDLLAMGTLDKAKILVEASSLAWRALALSQELHERFGAPLAPGANLPTETK